MMKMNVGFKDVIKGMPLKPCSEALQKAVSASGSVKLSYQELKGLRGPHQFQDLVEVPPQDLAIARACLAEPAERLSPLTPSRRPRTWLSPTLTTWTLLRAEKKPHFSKGGNLAVPCSALLGQEASCRQLAS